MKFIFTVVYYTTLWVYNNLLMHSPVAGQLDGFSFHLWQMSKFLWYSYLGL